MLFAIAAEKDFEMCHVDICQAFGTALLENPIAIHMPECTIKNDPSLEEGKVIFVSPALYGLVVSLKALLASRCKTATNGLYTIWGRSTSPVS